MIFNDYETFIFDLDGTIVNLNVDWFSVRNDLIEQIFDEYNCIIPYGGISSMIQNSVSMGCSNTKVRLIVSDILKKHESCAEYTVVPNVIEKINNIPKNKKMAVLTNNLNFTASKVINDLKISNRFNFIVGFDDVNFSKPNIEGMTMIGKKLNINLNDTIFIGDSVTDKTTANKFKISYISINDFLK